MRTRTLTSTTRTLLPIILLALLICMAGGEEPEREWVSTGGSRIRAKLISFTNGKATLLVSPDRRVVVPLEQLSPDDQAYIGSWSPKDGEHWKAVPSVDLQVKGTVAAGDSIVLRPRADRRVKVAQGGRLREPIIIDATAAESVSGRLDLVICAVLPVNGVLLTSVNQVALKSGQQEIKVDSATGGNTNLSGGGLRTGNLFVFLVDASEQCRSNILQFECDLP